MNFADGGEPGKPTKSVTLAVTISVVQHLHTNHLRSAPGAQEGQGKKFFPKGRSQDFEGINNKFSNLNVR